MCFIVVCRGSHSTIQWNLPMGQKIVLVSVLISEVERVVYTWGVLFRAVSSVQGCLSL